MAKKKVDADESSPVCRAINVIQGKIDGIPPSAGRAAHQRSLSVISTSLGFTENNNAGVLTWVDPPAPVQGG